ncbi:membrane protease subunit HflK [Thermotomaculum hydrothermale]|uniref:Protein HflK n=1 Tax=Thermotomaculum hydrothermale TaxID=981385 RepID=A0A7R6SZ95_9BACT|nr:FtsH protease activity modulator HflK [Thermotomaculum hydrothermale]BBB32595.1 membrane protease subunit HflK [Thermotomaculum hydrothermale]
MEVYTVNPDIEKYKKQARKFLFLLWLIPLIILAFTSYYTIAPDEVGVVTRFGKFVRIEKPGLHFKIPFGVEIVKKVPVKKQLKEEFGFRTLRAGIKSQYSTENYLHESLMLTGDLNIGEIEWSVQYKIKDPVKYLFKVRDVKGTFRNICEAVMREVIGDRSINEILTTGREEIAQECKNKIQKLCNEYETGLDVKLVVLQDVNPPDPVKPSFNEVNQALQEKENMINQAWAQYNKVIPNEKGKALQIIQEAEGYALKRVNEAKGDVAMFNDVLKEYKKAPKVTKDRLYLETMQKLLPKFGKVIVIDSKQKNILPLLDLMKGGK